MGASYGRGLLHLAAAVDSAAVDPAGTADADAQVELVRLAERGGLDFVTLAGDGTPPGLAARALATTRRIGVVPVPGEGVEDVDPAHRQRTGVWADGGARGAPPRAGAGGGGSAPAPPVRVIDATAPGARAAAARYADVAVVRVADAVQAGIVRDELRERAAGAGRDPDGLRVLAGLLVDLGDGEYAAEPGHGGGGPRPTVHGPLYRGGPVDLAELIAVWHKDGAVDGFHCVPVAPRRDLERLVNGTVALLQHRGLFRTFYPGSTLREHLGLRPLVPTLH
ncbi:FMNH2-dependent monooxygenase [Streptomyces longwoodensis]|uniref:FMNH2-dependent monooxygenase n=1 Tax=Streptomyces longwoodensis TaxID=68231 RepID=UPI0036EE0D99